MADADLETEMQHAMDEADAMLLQTLIDHDAAEVLLARLRHCIDRAHDADLLVGKRQLERVAEDLADRIK